MPPDSTQILPKEQHLHTETAAVWQIFLIGMLSLFSISAALFLFLGDTRRSASATLDTEVIREDVPPKISTADPSNTPIYTSFKLIRADQTIVITGPGTERTVVVQSVHKSVPELSGDQVLKQLVPGKGVFVGLKPETDEGTWSRFYTYDPARGSFTRVVALEALPLLWGSEPLLSPDGHAAVLEADGEDGQYLYYVDLVHDTATPILALARGETTLTAPNRGRLKTDIQWVDDTMLSVGIYTAADDYTQLLRREELILERVSIPSRDDTVYEVVPSYGHYRQNLQQLRDHRTLIGFEADGTAATVISDVFGALAALGEYRQIEIVSAVPLERKIIFSATPVCDGSCGDVRAELVFYDMRTQMFTKLSISSYWNPKILTSSKTGARYGGISPDGRYLLSVYSHVDYEDRGTLYRIDLVRDEVQVLGSLSVDHPNDEYESFVRDSEVAEIEWLDDDRFYITVYAGNYAAGGNSDHMVGNGDQLIRKELYSLQEGLISPKF